MSRKFCPMNVMGLGRGFSDVRLFDSWATAERVLRDWKGWPNAKIVEVQVGRKIGYAIKATPIPDERYLRTDGKVR